MGVFSTKRTLLSITTGDELCKGLTTFGRYSKTNGNNNSCKNLAHIFKSNINPNFRRVIRKLSDIFIILNRVIPSNLRKYANDKAGVMHILPENNNDVYIIEIIGKGIYIKIPKNESFTKKMRLKLQQSRLADKAEAQRAQVANNINKFTQGAKGVVRAGASIARP